MTIRMVKTAKLSQTEISQRLRAAFDAILKTAADIEVVEASDPATVDDRQHKNTSHEGV